MGAAAGLAAGLVGAIAWALLAWFAHIEIGWLAWGIGLAVGIACAAGSSFGSDNREAKTGPALGLIAVVITLLSICGGKFAAVEADIQVAVAEAQQQRDAEANQAYDEATLVSWMADRVGFEAHGPQWQAEYQWPKGIDPSQAVGESDYPPRLWAEASKQWETMSADQRAEFESGVRQQIRKNYDDYIESATAAAREEGFMASFGAMDLLFFGLAVVTAWRIAGAGESAD